MGRGGVRRTLRLLLEHVLMVSEQSAQPVTPPFDIGASSLAGRRPENQDRCLFGDRWAVLSDGVGGNAGGWRAAELTCEAVAEVLSQPGGSPEETLLRATDLANERVRAERKRNIDISRMGATAIMAVATDLSPARSWWAVASVGDSPGFVITFDAAYQFTEDHTFAAELLRSGSIDLENSLRHPGRNVLMRAIGSSERVQPDVHGISLVPGDCLVMTSDGVSGQVPPYDIRRIVRPTATAAEATELLVAEALKRGSTDNASALVIRHQPGHP